MAYEHLPSRPNFKQIMPLKPCMPIGCLFDIPTCRWLTGAYGESLQNAGIGLITGVVGRGNRFKTTLTKWMIITILKRFVESIVDTYDTEMNVQEQDLFRFMRKAGLNLDDFFNPYGRDRWHITDESLYMADAWFEIIKEFYEDKKKNLNKWLRQTPFLDRDGKTPLKLAVPNMLDVDSFSKFTTSDVLKLIDDNALGESGGNTIYMRQGLSKKRFLSEIPRMAQAVNMPVFLTAHVGSMNGMQDNSRVPPPKRLQHMNQNEDIKGVTGDFSFLTSFCVHCVEASVFLNDKTKTVEYPKNSDDTLERDSDLNRLKIMYLRNKNGRSGLTAEILVSQNEGVLPSLTEFYYSKINDRDYEFAYNGNDKNYQHCFMPSINLSRTTVRTKLEVNERLRKAVLFGSELTQMHWLNQNTEDKYRVSAKKLFNDLKDRGYKIEELLDTRSWWTFDNDKQSVPYLSTMDLLKMRVGEYHPYWMKTKPDDGFVQVPQTYSVDADGVIALPSISDQIIEIPELIEV